MPRRSFVAGNWKMNKTLDEARALAGELREKLAGFSGCDVAVFPAFVCLAQVAEILRGSNIGSGAQNLYWEKSGAFTGEVSGPMIAACGCQYVLCGHSERRQFFGESDETVNKRIKAALAVKLKPIACVGETKDQRTGNTTREVIKRQVEGALAGLTKEQMADLTLAYEPVWAIGTGLTATPAQAQEVHAFIRGLVKEQFGTGIAEALRIQYGGSVKADNARELMQQADIDGALVGGASLVAKDFEAIVKAAT
jgi:triosephosphate isomerase